VTRNSIENSSVECAAPKGEMMRRNEWELSKAARFVTDTAVVATARRVRVNRAALGH
jgi:hypothetical protein